MCGDGSLLLSACNKQECYYEGVFFPSKEEMRFLDENPGEAVKSPLCGNVCEDFELMKCLKTCAEGRRGVFLVVAVQ